MREAAGALLLIATLGGIVPAASGESPPVKTRLLPDGSIEHGAHSLRPQQTALVDLIVDGENFACLDQEWGFPGQWIGSGCLVDGRREVEGGRIEYRGRLPLAASAERLVDDFHMRLDVLPDGGVRFRTECRLPPGAPAPTGQTAHVIVPFELVAGESIRVDDRTLACSAFGAPREHKNLFQGNAARIVFFPGVPHREFSFQVVTARGVVVREQRAAAGQGGDSLVVGLEADNGQVDYTIRFADGGATPSLDPGNAAEGVDFYAADRLHVPRYALCRNLLQNPSFEAGLRYWTFGPTGQTLEGGDDEPYVLDETERRTGRRSLRMTARAGVRQQQFSGFAVPVEAGAAYTVSFYAKAAGPNLALAVGGCTEEWPVFSADKTFAIGTEWTRHSFTFPAPRRALSLMFTPLYGGPDAESRLWLDGVQLEKGALTEYAEKPFAVELLTAERGQLFETGTPIAPRLRIVGRPGVSGTATVGGEDFDYQPLPAQRLAFTLDAAGEAILPLAFPDPLPKGFYVLSADVAASGFADREYFRLAVIGRLDPARPRAGFFGSVPNERHLARNRYLDRYHRIGLGCLYDWRPGRTAWRAALRANGIRAPFTCLFDQPLEPGGIEIGKLRKIGDLTPAVAEAIAASCARRVRETPEQDVWKLIDEPNGAMEPKLLAEIARLARAAALSVNPNARIVMHTPCNMAPGNGIRQQREFLLAGGLRSVDLAGINSYRPGPENPDLDRDFETYFTMLDALGFRGTADIVGGWHAPYHLPAYGLNCHRSGNDLWMGPLSYDVGRGERLSASYTARTWLAALKHGRRITSFVDWNYDRRYLLDYDQVPFALSLVPGVLGSLLGDAEFAGDVSLGTELRGYRFRDGRDRPVFALWSVAPAVDHGWREPSILSVPMANGEFSVEAIGLSGAAVGDRADGVLRVRMTPWPVFLRGIPGGSEALAAALARAGVTPGAPGGR